MSLLKGKTTKIEKDFLNEIERLCWKYRTAHKKGWGWIAMALLSCYVNATLKAKNLDTKENVLKAMGVRQKKT
jgi:hypothetical protein